MAQLAAISGNLVRRARAVESDERFDYREDSFIVDQSPFPSTSSSRKSNVIMPLAHQYGHHQSCYQTLGESLATLLTLCGLQKLLGKVTLWVPEPFQVLEFLHCCRVFVSVADWVTATRVGIRNKRFLFAVRAHDLLCSLVKLQDLFMYIRIGVPSKNVAIESVSTASPATWSLLVYPQPCVNILQSERCLRLPCTTTRRLRVPLNGED